MSNLELLTVAIFALGLFDWYSTRTILDKGGKEQNPVARKGMELFGIDGYLGGKAFAVAALGYFAGVQNLYFAVFILAVYIVAALHNAKSL